MLKDIRIIVGSAFLALGLFSNHVYGVELGGTAAYTFNGSDAPQGFSSERELSDSIEKQGISREEELWDFLIDAEGLPGSIGVAERVRSGVDLTIKREGGKTVLFWTICPIVLDLLLRFHNIDIDSQDDEDNSALIYFAQCTTQCANPYSEGYVQQMRMLLSRGANPLLKNTENKTARQVLKEWMEEQEALPEILIPGTLMEKCNKMVLELGAAEEEWIATHGE